MSIREEQEELSKLLEFAERRAAEKEFEISRRAIICAAAKLLCIAEQSTPTARKVIEEKAIQLMKSSIDLGEVSFEDIFEEMDMENMGCELEDNLDLFGRKEEKITFKKVAGLEDVKDAIRRQMIYPRKYTSLYSKYKKNVGGGMLLYGLPGTGKTLMAKAIASEINATFIEVKCSDIVSKWFGESEKKIKELFEEARSHKLSIIFFDEFEAIGSQRGEGSEAMNRLVPELLQEMQGFSSSRNVIVVCATNRPWDIDSAFLRPGRLTSRIYVPLPDEAARLTMIRNSFKGVPMSSNVDFKELARLTEGYSGADVAEVCDFAKTFAIEREIRTRKSSRLDNDDLLSAVRNIKSSIHRGDYDAMNSYNASFGVNTTENGEVSA